MKRGAAGPEDMLLDTDLCVMNSLVAYHCYLTSTLI